MFSFTYFFHTDFYRFLEQIDSMIDLDTRYVRISPNNSRYEGHRDEHPYRIAVPRRCLKDSSAAGNEKWAKNRSCREKRNFDVLMHWRVATKQGGVGRMMMGDLCDAYNVAPA